MEKLYPLSMMNKVRTIVLTLIVFLASNCSGQKSCVSIAEIYKLITKGFNTPSPVRVERYKDFDFVNFKPSGKVFESDFFEIGYDSEGRIIKIEHREIELHLTNYRLGVYDYPSFRLYTYETIESNGDHYYKPCVFVFVKSTKSHFLINIREQLGLNSTANSVFEKFPISQFSELSAVMMLDQSLYPKQLVRFANKRPFLVSEFVYSESMSLSSEQVYIIRPNEEFQINENMCLSEIENWINDCCDFSMTVQPRGNPKYRQVPFWIYAGAHFYH